MDTVETETIVQEEPETVRQDDECLIPIEDYAQKLGVSRRTVDRYARVGRIETKKHLGRTMVLDKPYKPAPFHADNIRTEQTTELAPLVQSDWLNFGQALSQAKAKTKWQVACLTFAVLFAGVTLAASVGGVWLHMSMQTKTDQLNSANEQVSGLQTQLGNLQLTLDNERVTVGRLQGQIAQLADQILELTDNLQQQPAYPSPAN
jgi:hypothetical protein